MRIRGYLIEYDLSEAAKILRIPARKLLRGTQEGKFQYFYHQTGNNYKFHDASIETNRVRLSKY